MVSKTINVTSSDVGPPLMCSFVKFQAPILISKPKINSPKNAQLMPNNKSKTIDFLVRLFSWFEESLKNNLNGKKHTI
jgi:hypothetical protein